jgi:hypothetical protein
MRGKDLEAGKAIERAFEDQVLERDGGVERISLGDVLRLPKRHPVRGSRDRGCGPW